MGLFAFREFDGVYTYGMKEKRNFVSYDEHVLFNDGTNFPIKFSIYFRYVYEKKNPF